MTVYDMGRKASNWAFAIAFMVASLCLISAVYFAILLTSFKVSGGISRPRCIGYYGRN